MTTARPRPAGRGPAGKLGKRVMRGLLGIVVSVVTLGAPAGTAFPSTSPTPNDDDAPPRIVVDRDDLVIESDCVLVAGPDPIADAAGDGLVRIVADGVTVSIDGAIRGAGDEVPPDRRTGIGIVILADRVTLRGGGVHGFRVGVEVRDADDVVIEDLDASHQFAQRLGSTPEREDAADWLWPHENDDGQWSTRYGASVRLVAARRPTLRRIHVRESQNGLMLERVEEAVVVDCDCSFLSGWGLAMWRTSDSTIARNAFDFCVRGYSHGVYNRGQDSAGILIFEQCERNRLIENSCTHGGDGIFGFGGREALGQVPPATPVDLAWHRHRGNRGNVFIGNDLSDAVAHGFEMTFSHGWVLESNRLHGNGICGVWGGYSSGATMRGNEFADNGSMAYGREGGGVNIEHGVGNRIIGNRFVRDTEGIELWWDEDRSLLETPWAQANDVRSADNRILDNRFEDCGIAVDLRRTEDTIVERNVMRGPGTGLVLEASPGTVIRANRIECAEPIRGGDLLGNGDPEPPAVRVGIDEAVEQADAAAVPGRTRPVGARRRLAGRDRIVMTEWGPYDWSEPLLRREAGTAERHEWRLLGPVDIARIEIDGPATAARTEELDRVIVQPTPDDSDVPGFIRYRLRVVPQGADPIEVEGSFPRTRWRISAFPTSADPRENPEAWARDREAATMRWTAPQLDLVYAMGGPTDVAPAEATADAEGGLPGRERFGTVAATSLRLPAGRYRLRILSDDGVRATLDGRRIIDNWTWHPPTEDVATFEIIQTVEAKEPRTVELVIEHFELDGYAVLRAELEPID